MPCRVTPPERSSSANCATASNGARAKGSRSPPAARKCRGRGKARTDHMNRIFRDYVHVGSRAVHYRRAGHGPPVVLIHQSPQSSAGLIPLIEALAPSASVFALDTPGCGDSDPLPQRRPSIGDFSAALCDALVALGLGRCTLFGTKTGACIALEYARRYPRRVTGVVLDSLPLLTPAEVADITRVVRTDDGSAAYYLMPFRPTWDGAHLVATWSHVRDHIFWFPWYRRKAESRRDIDMPSPAAMHDGVLDNFRAGDNLRRVVEAAFRYGASKAARRLTVPAIFTARDDSMLFHCLDMLPPLRRNQRVVRLTRDMAAYHTTLRDALLGYARGKAPGLRRPKARPQRISRTFVDLPRGQMLVRWQRDRTGFPLVLLHDSPGSSQQLEPLLSALVADRPVYAPDLPGSGDSEALARPTMDRYVAALAEGLRQWRLAPVDLYGEGAGAAVALAFARRFPASVRSLVLDDLRIYSRAERHDLSRAAAPPIVPSWDGSHLYRTWLMIRDHFIYRPWYARTRNHIRRVDLMLKPAELHARVLEVLKQPRHYGDLLQVALRYRPERDLPALRLPVLLGVSAADRSDLALERLRRRAPGVTVIDLPTMAAEKAAVIARFLDRRQ
ncbi:MAG: alpha/beta hydrolase [Alphaproteobacteria bacterium]|nr:alpha/beta hydrolase [Alphaproteobacteria bacterium]